MGSRTSHPLLLKHLSYPTHCIFIEFHTIHTCLFSDSPQEIELLSGTLSPSFWKHFASFKVFFIQA